MRVNLVLAVVTLVALLFALIGCNDDDNNTPGGANTFTVSGTTTNAFTGAADTATTVQLVQNGTAVGQPVVVSSTGAFAITGVQPGTYTLLVTTPTANGNVATIVGPVTITNANQTVAIPAFTQAQLETQGVVPAPGATTANLVIIGVNSAGQVVNTTATVNGTTLGPDAPVVFTNLAPGLATVSVDGTSIPGVTLAANTTTILQVLEPNATALTFAVTGTVRNAITNNVVSGATVTLLQNGAQVGTTTTTAANGTFTFSNVPQGKDYLVKVSGLAGTPVTYYGPFNVGLTTAPLTIFVATSTQLSTTFGVTTPGATTATLVVFAADATGNTSFNPTVTVNTNTPVTNSNPAILTGLTPGTVTVNVANGTTLANATASNIVLTGGAVTVLDTQFGVNNNF